VIIVYRTVSDQNVNHHVISLHLLFYYICNIIKMSDVT